MSNNRKYVAVSIKHTEYKWKFGMPCVLWGYHQTEDGEPRCFGGYTQHLNKAERYALGDFKRHGYGEWTKDDEPVNLSVDFCKKWKKYDTVLVDASQYETYCIIADLPIEPPKEE